MVFITLERPDVYQDIPVTINPEYIVSMKECFDNSKEFDYTELYLSNGTWYQVTSRIDEIAKMIRNEQLENDNPLKTVNVQPVFEKEEHNVFARKEDLEEAYQYFMKKNFGNAPEPEDKHACRWWDFGRHECGLGGDNCSDSSECCGFFEID